MITLTNAKAVPNVLGGTSTVSYDKFVVTAINYDTVNKRINGSIKLTCTADTAQTPLLGSFSILPQASPAVIQIDVPDVPFHRIINLSGAQQTAVLGWFDTVQAQIENGMISIGAIAGTQSTGV